MNDIKVEIKCTKECSFQIDDNIISTTLARLFSIERESVELKEILVYGIGQLNFIKPVRIKVIYGDNSFILKEDTLDIAKEMHSLDIGVISLVAEYVKKALLNKMIIFKENKEYILHAQKDTLDKLLSWIPTYNIESLLEVQQEFETKMGILIDQEAFLITPVNEKPVSFEIKVPAEVLFAALGNAYLKRDIQPLLPNIELIVDVISPHPISNVSVNAMWDNRLMSYHIEVFEDIPFHAQTITEAYYRLIQYIKNIDLMKVLVM